MEPRGLPALLKLSEAFRRENMVRASGKLGGVAGVFAGVHIYWEGEGEGEESDRTIRKMQCSKKTLLVQYGESL